MGKWSLAKTYLVLRKGEMVSIAILSDESETELILAPGDAISIASDIMAAAQHGVQPTADHAAASNSIEEN